MRVDMAAMDAKLRAFYAPELMRRMLTGMDGMWGRYEPRHKGWRHASLTLALRASRALGLVRLTERLRFATYRWVPPKYSGAPMRVEGSKVVTFASTFGEWWKRDDPD